MKRLEAILRERLRRGKLLVPFVTAGFPDETRFRELLPALAEVGADAIEIGLPFSDPLADGPVIQRSSARVLAQGMHTQRALELCAELATQLPIPLVAMGYVNPLLSYGLERFLENCECSGIRGLIVPDLPLEADPAAERLLAASAISRIQLVTPASGMTRIARLARAAEGFLYIVSRLGVTGGRIGPNSDLPLIIATLRDNCSLPLLTGFGIADADSAALAAELCDGVIVGSALLEKLETEGDSVGCAADFLATIRNGLDRITVVTQEKSL
jgi:tryptophan synthase alpha chain